MRTTGGLVTIDLDATIVIARSGKEQALPIWKTFGHHQMTAWGGHGADGSGEPLAIVLLPSRQAEMAFPSPAYERVSLLPVTPASPGASAARR